MDRPISTSSLDRRRLVGGAALAAAAGPLLAACGSNGGSDSGTASGGTGGGTSGAETNAPDRASGGTDLVATDKVPVGGGVILTDQKVVVTQPSQGTFKAFSAVCTHQGCLVNQISDGIIQCPCHGSQYSVDDGSVVRGPAPDPLPPVSVKVRAGEVVET